MRYVGFRRILKTKLGERGLLWVRFPQLHRIIPIFLAAVLRYSCLAMCQVCGRTHNDFLGKAILSWEGVSKDRAYWICS
jgi:hypothetical protein